jgi:hypothetical protein
VGGLVVTRFLFVGERPSPKAARIGATWHNGRLSAKNLREAIQAAGLDPHEQVYLNLWPFAEPDASDAGYQAVALDSIRLYLAEGRTVVGMGEIVCRVLRQEGIPHRQLVHPAARGSIRKRERYQAHVRGVLETVHV